MKIASVSLFILSIFTLTSCNDNAGQNKFLIGNWSAAEWLTNGKPSGNDIKSTHFTFNEKGGYTFESAGTKEAGTYKVENDMLFTTPDKQQEIMVKIAKLTKDSLVFDMNRAGEPETLTLIKK